MRNITKVILLTLLATLLASCSHKIKVKHFTPEQQAQLNRLINAFDNQLDQHWGGEALVPVPTEVVMYSDQGATRTRIDFAKGRIVFETVEEDYSQALKEQIIMTLLMSNYPEDGNIYSGINDYRLGVGKGKPFLINQISDQNNRAISSYQEAELFANYLLRYQFTGHLLKNGRYVYSINWHLVSDHLAERARKYSPSVYKIASDWKVDPRLMLAIMETESAFNPVAKSNSGAIGLMQIIPTTAGTDAFRLLGKTGKPSVDYLLDPDNNILISAVYMHIMQTRYFANIQNPLSLRYMLIASYNAGPGGTLTVFNKDRKQAIERINHLRPSDVYNILVNRHYSEQAKSYLKKVSKAYHNY